MVLEKHSISFNAQTKIKHPVHKWKMKMVKYLRATSLNRLNENYASTIGGD